MDEAFSVDTNIAKPLRGQNYDMLLMMDSITRFAMAQQEIGLPSSEPPCRQGIHPLHVRRYTQVAGAQQKF